MPANIERLRPQYLAVGEILRPHALRGEVRMRIITDYPEHLLSLDSVYIGDSAEDCNRAAIGLRHVRFHQSFAILELDGIKSRDEADLLRGKIVSLHIDDAIPLESGEYYLFQLIGMRVLDGDKEIGVVKDILQTGANDVYIVQSEAYGETLLPAHEGTIESIDFDKGIIIMKLPDGLLAGK